MKKIEKKNKLISPDRKALSAKRNTHGLVALAAVMLALALIVAGSIFSFAMAIKDSQRSDDTSGDEETVYVPKNAEIPEDKAELLIGFDAAIEELDEKIKTLDDEISQCESDSSPEKKVYIKELCDRRAGILLSKSLLCKEYSEICVEWAQETRTSLAEPIAVYEEYCELYKERLSAVYEAGFPDFGEIFGSSDTIMDFVMGNVLLDEIRSYDEELAAKVGELYSVVEDGLAVVKYYLARSDNYSSIKSDAQDEFYATSLRASGHISDISLDKDVYNYLLQYYAKCDQIFVKELGEIALQNAGDFDAAPEYLYPIGSEYFYTDYIGRGHENRIEWSPALGKYVNVFHSGIDLHTALSYADVKASADGKVVYADYCPSRGYTVALAHKDGLITLYSGCSLITVTLGQEVPAGDSIAYSGMSGEQQDFKVTFEVFDGTELTDPAEYIKLPDVSLSGSDS